jgi:hypothetical protein
MRKKQASDSCPNNEDMQIFDSFGAHTDNFVMKVAKGLRALMLGQS